MTSRELIVAEANNTDRIALYREGLFWKAYERSAFALCTQVRAFKPTRKILKTLAGGDIVSVGFPAIAADRILAGLQRLDASAAAAASVPFISDASAAAPQSATCMVYSAPHPIIDEEFRAWKSALPISLSIPRPAAVDTSSCDETSAAEECTAAAAGADFAAQPAQPRLWSRFGGWLVRWASGSGASSRADVGSADTSRSGAVAADTASSDDTAASASDILDALRNFEVADKTPMECMMFIAELKKRLLKI